MLDDRLLGRTFINPSSIATGVVELFGVYYHYQIEGDAGAGDLLEIIRITPLALIVRVADRRLDY
ncbi:hypothetical protein [Lapidilactobacillus luobeiensis]|uniref:hypothetical protein n=1 Tax=Lapidilactobacillus luobeiensis TaxID=2950371 RepID=UPI0021C2A511|nr:hypothetical protein [Lapidilactobacillus luobeiensis]